MKTIAQQLKIKKFPFQIIDMGNEIYSENSDGYWIKREYDEKGNLIYYENSDGKVIDGRPKCENTQQKLYTEEQVRSLLNKMDIIYSLEDLTPIELPSDDEIKSYSNRYSTIHEDVSDKLGKYLVSAIHIDGANWMKGQLYDGVRLKRFFIKDEGEEINGAKWMKEQILNQNK